MQKPSGSLISYFSNMVKDKGGINLAQGIPGFTPPAELLDLLSMHAQGENSLHQYAPGNGNFRLLELLAAHYSQHAPLNPDNVLIVQGATEGIFLSLLYLKNKLGGSFSALSFDPPYESYPILCNIFNIPFIYFDYKRNFAVDFDKLEKSIKNNNVKIIFVASPGNPLGRIWRQDELEFLLEIADAYECYIIYDAVYKNIYFEQPPFNPLAFQHERLFYIDSFSKMLSITGWRIGYLLTQKKSMQEIRGIHDYTGLCATTLFQKVIAEYLSSYNFGRDYTKSIRTACAESCSLLADQLTSLGCTVPDVHGGYFLWAQLPQKFEDAFSFAVELYQAQQVAVVPGENFSPFKKNFIRLNLAMDLNIIHEAVNRLRDFLS